MQYCFVDGQKSLGKIGGLSWIQDHLPMTICRIFHNLGDQSFIRALLGDYSVLNSSVNSFNDEFKLECAKYISHCIQNSVFDSFVVS